MRQDDKTFLTVFVVWAVICLAWAVICLAFLATVIFVAAHFVGKYW